MRELFPPSNVTKWRTTNKVLPRSLASRQSARGELLVNKSMGSVKRTTLLVCLGVCSEKSVVVIHMIIPFILLLLVKMFATTRRRSGLSFSLLIKVTSRWISLRFGPRSRRFFHEEMSKMTFFFVRMVLRKCCRKVYYHYRAKEATLDAVRAGEHKIGLRRERCEYLDSSFYSFSRHEIKLTLKILLDHLQDCYFQ